MQVPKFASNTGQHQNVNATSTSATVTRFVPAIYALGPPSQTHLVQSIVTGTFALATVSRSSVSSKRGQQHEDRT